MIPTMNLKLYRPNYIEERKKDNLDYKLFGGYMKKYGDKNVFTGGFGGNLHFKSHFIKKLNTLDVIKHQYEINTIVKRFNDSFKNKIKSNQNKNNSAKTIRSQLSSQDNKIIKLNLSSSVNNCLLFKKLIPLNKMEKTSCCESINSFGKRRSTSSHTDAFEKSYHNKKQMSIFSLEQKAKKAIYSYSYILHPKLEIDNDPFKVIEEDLRLVERNTLYEILRKQNNLIPKQKHCLDKAKWKIFNHTHIDHYNDSTCKAYKARKYSLKYVNAVKRKNCHNDSITYKLINDLTSSSLFENK